VFADRLEFDGFHGSLRTHLASEHLPSCAVRPFLAAMLVEPLTKASLALASRRRKARFVFAVG